MRPLDALSMATLRRKARGRQLLVRYHRNWNRVLGDDGYVVVDMQFNTAKTCPLVECVASRSCVHVLPELWKASFPEYRRLPGRQPAPAQSRLLRSCQNEITVRPVRFTGSTTSVFGARASERGFRGFGGGVAGGATGLAAVVGAVAERFCV